MLDADKKLMELAEYRQQFRLVKALRRIEALRAESEKIIDYSTWDDRLEALQKMLVADAHAAEEMLK